MFYFTSSPTPDAIFFFSEPSFFMKWMPSFGIACFIPLSKNLSSAAIPCVQTQILPHSCLSLALLSSSALLAKEDHLVWSSSVGKVLATQSPSCLASLSLLILLRPHTYLGVVLPFHSISGTSLLSRRYLLSFRLRWLSDGIPASPFSCFSSSWLS